MTKIEAKKRVTMYQEGTIGKYKTYIVACLYPGMDHAVFFGPWSFPRALACKRSCINYLISSL